MEKRKKSSTSELSSSMVPFYNNDEIESDEEPILIKSSFSQEVYHGSALKSKIELTKCQEIPRYFKQYMLPTSTPSEDEDFDMDQCLRAKLREANIRLTSEDEEEKRSCFFKFMNIVLIIFIPILLGYFSLSLIPKYEPIPVEKVEKELRLRLLNQEHSIDTVVNSLRELQGENKQILTCLIGPTGVGKSHLVNILNEQMSSETMKVLYNFNLDYEFNKERIIQELSSMLHSPNFRILVLDDLKIVDIKRLQQFIETSFSIKNTSFLILTVFNEDSEDCLGYSAESSANSSFVKKKLKHLSKQFYLAHFNYLNESIARQWLQEELRARNVKTEFHDEIMADLLRSHDVKCHGLKRLHQKLKLLS